MPLDRFVLLLFVVMAAAGVTVLLGAFVAAALVFPRAALAGFVPVLLVGYVIWRVIAHRLASREDSHYDKIDP